MKKFIPAILCLILLAGTLTGCTDESEMAYASMIKLLENMYSITEGEISVELSFPGRADFEQPEASGKNSIAESELIKAFWESEIDNISVDSSMSMEKQQLQMAIGYSSANGESGSVTDIIVDGGESYVNMTKMLDFVSPLIWNNTSNFADYRAKFFTAIMDGSEYVYAGDPGIWESEDSFASIASNLVKSFYTYMSPLDVVTMRDEVYYYTLEEEDYRYVATGIMSEMKNNSETLAGSIIGALGLGNIGLLKTELPEVSAFSAELANYLNDQIRNLNSNDTSGLKMAGSIGYEMESEVYTQSLTFFVDDEPVIAIKCSVSAKEAGEIAAPEIYLTREKFEENLEKESSSLYRSGDTVYSPNLVYTAIPAEAMVPFVVTTASDTAEDPNATDGAETPPAFTNLQPYDFTAKSGAVYSVPLFISDYIKTYSDVLIARSHGMWQFYESYINDGDTAKSSLERYVQDIYNLNYNNPSNSNMFVAPGESVAAMSFSYDNPEYGKVTMIYIAMVSSSGEDILLMSIDMYHDFMEDVDFAILDELSGIIGFNLSEFYSP